MAFISSGYNTDKPMENRISDIGPQKYDLFYPPVIAKNKGNIFLDWWFLGGGISLIVLIVLYVLGAFNWLLPIIMGPA